MDRETLTQVVVSIGIVLLFVGVLAVLSVAFSSNDGLTEAGGYALVGALVGFVIVISGAGLAVTNHFEGENGDAA